MARRSNGEGSISKRADGRWAARLTLPLKNGRRQRRSFYGATKEQAARAMRDFLKRQDDGLPATSDRLSLAAHLDAWLRDVAGDLRPRTVSSYEMIVRQHLTPTIGAIRLAKLSPDDVRGYLRQKHASGLSARTVQYHHAVLRAALGQAEQDGKVVRNVAKLARPPKIERPEIRPLSPREVQVFLNSVVKTREGAIFVTAIALGLRQSELLGLTWADLDLDTGRLTVRRSLQRYGGAYHLDGVKTEKSRRVLGLPLDLVQVLAAHKRQQLEERLRAGPAWQGDVWGLVFCTETGLPLNGTWLTHHFEAQLRALGLPAQRFHDLRHACASYMLTQGVDLKIIQAVLGHATIATTAGTYAHVQLESTRLAAAAVGELLAQ